MSPDFEAARAERFKPGSGIPLRIPVIDLIEIGAGGGSIARKNELGLLKVGPSSAGAEPGPACYGRGGTAPTVTDANTLLGYLSPTSFLGGSMTLDESAARSAVDQLAGELGLETLRTAWGIYDVVNESMAAAMRSHIAERNRDPRKYTMFAFGGAGPVHAVAVARKVGIPEVIVPLGAGVTSALGLLTAPMAIDLVQSAPMNLEDVAWSEITRLLGEMVDRGRAAIALGGAVEAEIKVEYAVDMQYVGQAHEITVRLPGLPSDIDIGGALRRSFDEAYLDLYSVLNDSFEIEVLNWRVRVAGNPMELWFEAKTDGDESTGLRRPIWEPNSGAFVEAPVLNQSSMTAGTTYPGPLIVEQRETTAVIGANDAVTVDNFGNLRVQVNA